MIGRPAPGHSVAHRARIGRAAARLPRGTGRVSGGCDDRGMDDRRVGLVIRALRRRRAWRQSDLAAAARVSQSAISLVERGHVDTMSLRTLRRIFLALEARGDLDVRWRGGSLDRVVDERHADVAAVSVRSLTNFGLGSCGRGDVRHLRRARLARRPGLHRPTASPLVIEVKTELTSIEETLRRLDQEVRLASRICRERFGSAASGTSSLLVMPDNGSGSSAGDAPSRRARCRPSRRQRRDPTLARRAARIDPRSLVSGEYEPPWYCADLGRPRPRDSTGSRRESR